VPETSPESLQQGGFIFMQKGWHCKNWQKSTDSHCFIFQFGGAWNFVRVTSPPKIPRSDGTGLCDLRPMSTTLFFMLKNSSAIFWTQKEHSVTMFLNYLTWKMDQGKVRAHNISLAFLTSGSMIFKQHVEHETKPLAMFRPRALCFEKRLIIACLCC